MIPRDAHLSESWKSVVFFQNRPGVIGAFSGRYLPRYIKIFFFCPNRGPPLNLLDTIVQRCFRGFRGSRDAYLKGKAGRVLFFPSKTWSNWSLFWPMPATIYQDLACFGAHLHRRPRYWLSRVKLKKIGENKLKKILGKQVEKTDIRKCIYFFIYIYTYIHLHRRPRYWLHPCQIEKNVRKTSWKNRYIYKHIYMYWHHITVPR